MIFNTLSKKHHKNFGYRAFYFLPTCIVIAGGPGSWLYIVFLNVLIIIKIK